MSTLQNAEIVVEPAGNRSPSRDLISLLLLVLGILLMSVGTFLVFGIGVSLICAGVALAGFGTLLGISRG